MMKEYRFVFNPWWGAGERTVFIGDIVSSQELAEGQVNLIANYTLHLHECSLMPDYSNYGCIQWRDDDHLWHELDEDETSI